MPRAERIILLAHPRHIVQRGHNRQPIFAEPRDYERYLETLREFKYAYDVKVYAYGLMTNHVHLLRSPETPSGIGKLMKRLAGRQTRYHNALEGRSGTLWEGRYKSSPVDTDAYLLACDRYIELNPVRARICAEPAAYSWSSYRQRLTPTGEWLDLDPAYLSLGRDQAECRSRYRVFLDAAIPDGEWSLIREALQRGQLTGGDRFADEVEAILGRRVARRGRGRPKKAEK